MLVVETFRCRGRRWGDWVNNLAPINYHWIIKKLLYTLISTHISLLCKSWSLDQLMSVQSVFKAGSELIVWFSHHAQFLQMLTGNRRELSRATWRSYVTVILVSKWGLFLTSSVFLFQRRDELKIIIFEHNYLTVLVYTKTIIHRRGGGYWWKLPCRFATFVNNHY